MCWAAPYATVFHINSSHSSISASSHIISGLELIQIRLMDWWTNESQIIHSILSYRDHSGNSCYDQRKTIIVLKKRLQRYKFNTCYFSNFAHNNCMLKDESGSQSSYSKNIMSVAYILVRDLFFSWNVLQGWDWLQLFETEPWASQPSVWMLILQHSMYSFRSHVQEFQPGFTTLCSTFTVSCFVFLSSTYTTLCKLNCIPQYKSLKKGKTEEQTKKKYMGICTMKA